MEDMQQFQQLGTTDVVSTVANLIKNDVYPDTGVIMKRNYNQYGQVESLQILNEAHTIYKNRIVLNQIPTTYFRVKIDGLSENTTSDDLEKNQFRVVYDSGIVFFNEELEGQEITVSEYYGCGIEMIPISRIYSDIKLDGTINATLYDIIKVGTNAIVALNEVGGVLAEGKKVSTALEENTASATAINNSLVTNIPKAHPLAVELDNSVATATSQLAVLEALDKSLNSDVAIGVPLNKSLEANIKTIEGLNTNIASNIASGEQVNSSLNTSISNAQNLNSVLSGATQIAERVTVLGQTTATNTLDINNNKQNILNNTKQVAQNKEEILTNQTNISLNKNLIEQNTANITGLQDAVLPSGNLIAYSDFRALKGITSSAYGFAYGITAVPVVKGKTYTLTVSGCISNTAQKDSKGGLMVCLYDNNWSGNGCTVWINTLEPSTSSMTFTANKTEALYISAYSLGNKDGSKPEEDVTVYWYCLREGTTSSSEWVESPYVLNAGVNQFSGSNFSGNAFTGGSTSGQTLNTTDTMLKEGVVYTLTAYGVSRSNLQNESDTYFNSKYGNGNSSTPFLQFLSNMPTVKSVTFTCPKTDYYNLDIYAGDSGNVDIFWYTLTEGEKGCAWSPSLKEMTGSDQLEPLGFAVTQLDLGLNHTNKQVKAVGTNTAQLMLKTNELNKQSNALGKNATEMMIVTSSLNSKSDLLGKSTTQLILDNNKLKNENEDLGKIVTTLVLQNNKLQEQLETLAKVIVKNELK